MDRPSTFGPRSSATLFGLLLASTLLATPQGSLAQDFDLTGDWILNVESPNGMGERQVTFVQEGNTLTGTISSSMATGDLTGTIDGNSVTFAAVIIMSGGAFEIVYTATYEDGTLKDGTVDFGEYGSGGFTGRRKESGGPGPSLFRPRWLPDGGRAH